MRFQGNNLLDGKRLGARIRLAREQAKLSQEELAAAVSKDQGAISEYEIGRRKLAAADLPAFAKALNVSIMYFYEEHEAHDLDDRILEEFRQLPTTELKQAAIQIVRVLSTTIGSHSAT